ncbi:MAG: nickel pincer cofactor biosynthesis protein LarC [Clostridia bacterium]|nr:nickel pincer cofactor biosynthesis protein LarC [Clostridia bacterium]
MKTLYFNCMSGASGDMLTAALLGLFSSPLSKAEELNAIGIPDVTYIYEQKIDKFGLAGSSVTVDIGGETEHEHHSHHHFHRNLKEIEEIINGLNIKENIKKDVMAVYGIIAKAESEAHKKAVSDIHFHELGMLDAIADITAVCYLLDCIKAENIICSPINVGSGTVKCAHGVVSVPAPATANILRGVPIYSAKEKSELCTPTGAALLKYFANRFGDMPIITPTATASGFGKKEFSLLSNKLDVILGETEDQDDKDSVIELTFCVDDMTGEEIGFATEVLREGGAIEVYTKSVYMKKSRIGTEFTLLCKEEDKSSVISLVFNHTSTIGLREKVCKRYVLKRNIKTYDTSLGKMRVKTSTGFGVKRIKLEYDDIIKAAKEQNLTYKKTKRAVLREIRKKRENG